MKPPETLEGKGLKGVTVHAPFAGDAVILAVTPSNERAVESIARDVAFGRET